jgi:hypothetical protein
MTLILSDALASAMADAVTTAVDAGAGAGHISAYVGALPSDLDPTGDTKLAEWALADPAAAAAIAGVATWDFAPDLSTTVLASGTAGYFLVFDSDNVVKFGGTIGTTGEDMNFDTVAWVAGGLVVLTDGTVTQPTS